MEVPPDNGPEDAGEEHPEGPRELSLDALENEITTLAARMTSNQAHWLRLVAEFDRRDGWATWGMRSCADWIAWRCALSSRSAREQVQVARALEDLPLIRAEFERGALSYSKVRALIRIADAESESDLLELAGHTTASQLIGAVRGLERVDRTLAEERQERRDVSWFWDDDGCLEVRATLPPEEGAMLVAAIESARDELFALDADSEDESGAAAPLAREDHGAAAPQDEIRIPPPTNADALLYVAEKAVSRAAPPGNASDRHQVVVHLDLDDDHAHVEGGPGLCPETARRFGCDASTIASIERGDRPLSVGRRTRVVPPPMRRALSGRDPCCRFPGCGSRRGLDAHHVVHWQDGGETSLDNLVLLCRPHHRAVHEGGCSVEQAGGGGFKYRDAHDRELEPAPRAPSVATAPRTNGMRATGAGPLITGSGESAERARLVDALLAIRREARERRRAAGKGQPPEAGPDPG